MWAFGFGVAPDLLSFGLLSFMSAVGLASGPDWSNGLPKMSEIPAYVHMMYNITHSIFVFAVAFALVTILRRKIFWPMFAWLLHIAIDIPTHSLRFFATPFLWPLSDYKFDGIGWSNPLVFFPNAALLIILYALFLFSKLRKR